MASTQSCVMTVVPQGLGPDSTETSPKFRFSLHIAPRLVPVPGENQLQYFAPFDRWPDHEYYFGYVYLEQLDAALGVAGASIAATRISPAPDMSLWESLFSPTMPVIPFDAGSFADKFAESAVRSYPALALHARQKEFLRNRVVQNEQTQPTPADMVAELGPLCELDQGFDKEVRQVIESEFPPRNSQSSWFRRVLSNGPSRPLYGENLSSVADHMQLLTFLAPRTSNEFLDANPSIDVPQVDFHRAMALLSDHPALLRALGLVIDYECDPFMAELGDNFQNATWVRLSTEPFQQMPPGSIFRFPHTRLDPTTFLAGRRDQSLLTADRWVDLRTPYSVQNHRGWEVTSLDVEGTAVKMVNVARTSGRADAIPVGSSSRPAAIDSPAPRSGGMSLMQGDRAVAIWDAFRETATRLATAPDEVGLYLDDLVRGYRVDVYDHGSSPTTAAWRSLMRRDIVYTPNRWTDVIHAPDDHTAVPGPPTLPQPPVYLNEGVVSTAVTGSPDPAAPDDKFVQEALFEWSGWSLVAPRPGQALADGSGAATAAAPAPTNPELDLTIDVTATAGSLPRLRYGHEYSFRLRTADITGSGPSVADGGGLATSGYPTVASRYVRWEPVPPPVIVQRDPLSIGEGLTNIVLRSFDADTDPMFVGQNRRYLLPPSSTAATVELHGMLDSMTAAESYELLLRRDGQRLTVGPSPEGILPAYTGLPDRRSDSTNPTPYFPDRIVVAPWLVDPMASGLRLKGPEALEAIIRFSSGVAGEWMNVRGWEVVMVPLAVDEVPTMVVRQDKRTITIGIAIGEQYTMPLSSTVSEDRGHHLGAHLLLDERYAEEAVSDPVGAGPDRIARRSRIKDGKNRQVSPPTALTLVHAVQVPVLEPYFHDDTLGVRRDLGSTSATFFGAIRVHRRSTGRLDVDMTWDDPIDSDPAGPTVTSGRALLEPAEVGYPVERTGLHRQMVSAVTQNFGDTKHRNVSLGVTATTRYAEYFARRRKLLLTGASTTLIKPADKGIQKLTERVVDVSTGRVLDRGSDYTIDYDEGTIRGPALAADRSVQVRFVPLPLSIKSARDNRRARHVLSSARPAPPVVRDVMPLLVDGAWADLPPGGFAGQSRTRDGRALRVYFERPWFSSGADEMIAVILRRSDRVSGRQYTGVVAPRTETGSPRSAAQKVTSAWGRDPLVVGDPTSSRLTIASFPLAASGDAFNNWVLNLTAPGVEMPIIAVPHRVEYDTTRDLWYSDIAMRLGRAYRPFVRLALARFQPFSLEDAHLSEIVTLDSAQLSPLRTLSVYGTGATRVVMVTGPAYSAADTGVPPSGVLFDYSVANTRVHRKPAPVLEVQVQTREPGGAYASSDPDIGWFDVPDGRYPMAMSATPNANGDRVFVVGGVDVSTPVGRECRLVVREFESDTRPIASGGNRQRLAYLDTFPIV